MEVGQADQVDAEKRIFMKKSHSFSLAKEKVVYARDEDYSDTLIIRNLFPKVKEHYKIFGLKGETNIKILFFSMMTLYKNEMKMLQKKVRFVKKEEFNELSTVIYEIEDEIQQTKTIYGISEMNDKKSIRFPTDADTYINVSLSSKVHFPYITLCNEDANRQYINSTSLFIGEGIKLLKYINTRFNFIQNAFKIKARRDEELFKSDSFF